MKMPINQDDSDRLGLALMKKLDIPPNNVSSGSIVREQLLDLHNQIHRDRNLMARAVHRSGIGHDRTDWAS